MPGTREFTVILLFLLLIAAIVIMGLVGFLIKGLLWLFVIACVLFLASLIGGALTARGRWVKRHTIVGR